MEPHNIALIILYSLIACLFAYNSYQKKKHYNRLEEYRKHSEKLNNEVTRWCLSQIMKNAVADEDYETANTALKILKNYDTTK